MILCDTNIFIEAFKNDPSATETLRRIGFQNISLSAVTLMELLAAIEKELIRRGPDRVLVYGDTNSTLAGALAAAKLHIPVAHIEAGLRSFNRRMPEEINRILTDHISDLLFCPSQTAAANLAAEGVTEGVHQVGDVMYDAALVFGDLAERKSKILASHGLTPKQYALATVHRAELCKNKRTGTRA